MTSRLPDFIQDTIDVWASDFAETPAFARLEGEVKEHAPAIAREFLRSACACAGGGPADLTESEACHTLLDAMPRLDFPFAVRREIPAVLRAFLETLEDAGRLADGRAIGLAVVATAPAYLDRLNPKGGMKAPPLKPASNVGRNDPCPCGSGAKFKKCCGKSG